MEQTKELKNLIKAIDKFIKKHDGNVEVIGTFTAYNPETKDSVEDIIVGYGKKQVIKQELKMLTEDIKKEKEFINW